MLVDAMALESIATHGRAWYFETRTLSLRVGALVAVCVVAIGCRSGAAKVDAGPCASDVAPLPESIQRGMSVAHNYQDLGTRGYGSNTSDHTLRELARFGVEWVSLTPFGFMRSLDEPTVHFIGDYPGGETCCIANNPVPLADIEDHTTNYTDVDCRLKNTEYPSQQLAALEHHMQAHRVQGNINHPECKNQQPGQEERDQFDKHGIYARQNPRRTGRTSSAVMKAVGST